MDISRVEVRRAGEPDLPSITEIYNDAIMSTTGTFDTEPRTLADRSEWFQAHDVRHPILVAVSDARVVGWAALSPWSERKAYDETAEISVYVAESFRGRGIGQGLVKALVEVAQIGGYHTLLARVAGGNAASLRMHAAAGFAEIGVMREVGVKFGRRLDVHLLQRMVTRPGARTELKVTPA
jgi:L-amino acid N-acyltransferase YncA